MGTRHLTCVVVDGEYRIAQYGQWDGYPDGAGLFILETLRTNDLDAMRERALACKTLSSKDILEKWVECGADLDSKFVNMEVSDTFNELYPQLHRDMGYQILAHIMATEGEVEVMDRLSFAEDSLFCEWAYVVDFDLGLFEVYKGFCKHSEAGGRFSGLHTGGEYAPVQLLAGFSLNELPDDEEFMKTVAHYPGGTEVE